MAKQEISWKKTDEFGEKWQVYAKRTGKKWAFYYRQKRYESWEPMGQIELNDWLELLSGVDRRINRQLLKPEESKNVRTMILRNYPDTELPPPVR